MCLEEKSTGQEMLEAMEDWEKSPTGLYVGWKVFLERDGKLYGEIFGRKPARPRRRWLKSDDFSRRKRLTTECTRRHYPAGWHIFVDEQAAQDWVNFGDETTKVLFRNVVVHGYQHNEEVVVAKEIFIP